MSHCLKHDIVAAHLIQRKLRRFPSVKYLHYHKDYFTMGTEQHFLAMSHSILRNGISRTIKIPLVGKPAKS
jgi:hypothetical protein